MPCGIPSRNAGRGCSRCCCRRSSRSSRHSMARFYGTSCTGSPSRYRSRRCWSWSHSAAGSRSTSRMASCSSIHIVRLLVWQSASSALGCFNLLLNHLLPTIQEAFIIQRRRNDGGETVATRNTLRCTISCILALAGAALRPLPAAFWPLRLCFKAPGLLSVRRATAWRCSTLCGGCPGPPDASNMQRKRCRSCRRHSHWPCCGAAAAK